MYNAYVALTSLVGVLLHALTMYLSGFILSLKYKMRILKATKALK